jgi:hypothetical protein
MHPAPDRGTTKEFAMFATSRSKQTALFAAVAAVALAAATLMNAPAAPGTTAARAAPASVLTAEEAIAQIEAEDGVLRFDVAEDAIGYAWAGDPELTDGLPAKRTAFLTQGYLYPEGTLTEDNGVNPDGSPEFPDKVLGQWSCYGWRLAAGAPDRTAPWLTTHLFNFGGEWGEATLVSEGYSIDDLGVPLERAIVGGTGAYVGARGQVTQTAEGENGIRNVLEFETPSE